MWEVGAVEGEEEEEVGVVVEKVHLSQEPQEMVGDANLLEHPVQMEKRGQEVNDWA